MDEPESTNSEDIFFLNIESGFIWFITCFIEWVSITGKIFCMSALKKIYNRENVWKK